MTIAVLPSRGGTRELSDGESDLRRNDGPSSTSWSARVLDLKRRVVEIEPLVQEPFQVAPDAVAVAAGRDEDVGGQCGEPDVIVQMCRSCTSTTPSVDAMRRPTSSASMPAGVSSSKDRHRVAQDPPRLTRMSSAIAIAAIGSA